ncbi:MAG: type II toxin-antitoxin system PemK/MazF family toxin [Pseudomonadota bacterium]
MATSDLAVCQWDIVVVPFPYSDQLAEKRRPALIVSHDEFNAATGLLWVVMITTSRTKWHGDVSIQDHEAVRLPVPSIIRTAKIATIEASRVLRVAGRLGGGEVEEVKSAVLSSLT